MSSRFPYHFLLMWLHHHTAYRHVLENQHKKKQKHEKHNFFTQHCFEWKAISDIGNDAVTLGSSIAIWYSCWYFFNNKMNLKIHLFLNRAVCFFSWPSYTYADIWTSTLMRHINSLSLFVWAIGLYFLMLLQACARLFLRSQDDFILQIAIDIVHS